MDASLIFAFRMFFSGGLENFFITLRAVNFNFSISVIILSLVALIPTVGILLYQITHKIKLFKKLKSITYKHLLISTLSILFLLISIDISVNKSNNFNIEKNQKRLPLGSNIISATTTPTKKFLIKPKNSELLLNDLKINNLKLKEKPNIIIFVVETTRKDFITEDIAPNLFAFKNENISFEKSYSSANNTAASWFSIFHSNHSLFWTETKKTNEIGSIPLNVFKKLGYKINVYTSSEMTYFQMDKLIFGKNRSLADNFFDFSKTSTNPANRDFDTINAFKNDLLDDNNKKSNIFIVFLDSPHSDYAWHESYTPKKYPFAKQLNYITLSQSRKDLPLIINRYKNSLGYIDYLFSDVVKTLKNKNIYDDSIIVFTGDHGEEFDENGALFHSSHLNEYQLSVPIFYKLSSKKSISTNITSHIDIFPTLLHIVTDIDFSKYFNGSSIFSKDINNYTISVNQKGALPPDEVLITYENNSSSGSIKNRDNLNYFELFVDPLENLDNEILKDITSYK
ncbi:MAG: sulfatase-like hydrolase/transferase [Parachlamydiales bacterium]|nr:sulfatase-like hydrolase/transferase [Parachlamydiales bacterium]